MLAAAVKDSDVLTKLVVEFVTSFVWYAHTTEDGFTPSAALALLALVAVHKLSKLVENPSSLRVLLLISKAVLALLALVAVQSVFRFVEKPISLRKLVALVLVSADQPRPIAVLKFVTLVLVSQVEPRPRLERTAGSFHWPPNSTGSVSPRKISTLSAVTVL